jgi:hypothetical protein
MIMTGRIYDIVIIDEKSAQIVVRKKDREKIYPVAIGISGYWMEKALKELKVKDKIRGNVFFRSKKYNDSKRYSTYMFFREIFVTEKAPIKMNELFDRETGEVFE